MSLDSGMQTLVSSPQVSNGGGVYLNYTPDANESGQDSFTLRVSDGVNNTETVFTVDITSLADAPVFDSSITAVTSSNPIVVGSGSTSSFLTLSASDADIPGVAFTFSEVTGYDSAYFTVSSGGQIAPSTA